jgi:hypothetical protein
MDTSTYYYLGAHDEHPARDEVERAPYAAIAASNPEDLGLLCQAVGAQLGLGDMANTVAATNAVATLAVLLHQAGTSRESIAVQTSIGAMRFDVTVQSSLVKAS